MSKKPPGDPGDAFRELVTQWERGFNSLANRIMGTEEFSRTMNQAQNAQLGAQKAFREFMAQNLSMANMPTRDDMVRLAETIAQLDKRMARIEGLLEAMSAPAQKKKRTGRKGPPRTKKPPSASTGTPSTANEDAAK